MIRRFLIGALIWFGLSAGAFAQGAGNFRAAVLSGGCPLGAKYYLNFAQSQYCGLSLSSLTVTRTTTNGTATNLLPTSPSGYAYKTFGNNVAPITPGLGILVEEGRSNFFLNSAAPATQTITFASTGTYTAWVNGSGSLVETAGTGVGCGTGTATQGSPESFTLTVAGTCIFTVVGSLNVAQVELNSGTVSNPTSLIVTTSAVGVRGGLGVTAPISNVVNGTTVLVSASFNSPLAYATSQYAVALSDGTVNNRFSIFRVVTGTVTFRILASGATEANQTTASALNPNTTGIIGLTGAIVTNGSTAALNGVSAGSQSPTALPAGINRLSIGQSEATGANYANGYIQYIIVIPRGLSPAALVGLT